MRKSTAKVVAPEPVPSRAEEWAKTWGEVVNKTVAGQMLGISRRQVLRLIQAGVLKTAADGRVLVRDAAEWVANGSPMTQKTKPRIYFVK